MPIVYSRDRLPCIPCRVLGENCNTRKPSCAQCLRLHRPCSYYTHTPRARGRLLSEFATTLFIQESACPIVSELSRLAAVVEALITLETFIHTDLVPQRPPRNDNFSKEESAEDSESADDDDEVSENSEPDDENCDEEDGIENGDTKEGRNEDDHREDGDDEDGDIEDRETDKDHSGTCGNQSTLGGSMEGVGGPPHQTESVSGVIEQAKGQDGGTICIGTRA